MHLYFPSCSPSRLTLHLVLHLRHQIVGLIQQLIHHRLSFRHPSSLHLDLALLPFLVAVLQPLPQRDQVFLSDVLLLVETLEAHFDTFQPVVNGEEGFVHLGRKREGGREGRVSSCRSAASATAEIESFSVMFSFWLRLSRRILILSSRS